MADDDRSRGARNARQIMMFREPIPMITPALRVLREIDSVAKRERRVAAFDDGREIENGKARHREI